ncbi:MAG TPA: isoprenylcysteine carboxylmethyltransferase family protein [Myxococcota bacterium]
MSLAALIAFSLFTVVVFGWRSVAQYRATGSTGFKGISGPPLSPSWWGGVLFVIGVVALPAAALLDVADLWSTFRAPSTAMRVAGGVLCALGMVGTSISQHTMGTSWRIGVDAQETTALVDDGIFGLVRNPIFTFMTIASIGFSLLVPHVLAIVGVVAVVVAIELQVRLVEEPYLIATHGDAWRAYAARVGRFVPGFGRWATASS